MDKPTVITLIDHCRLSLHTREWVPADSARVLHDNRADTREQKPRFRCNNTG